MAETDSPRAKKKVKKVASFASSRRLPNLLVSGTPGVGKSTLCKILADKVKDLVWVNVGEFAKEKNCLGEYDEELQCHELDEDKLVDELEELMSKGGVVLDHHMTDFYPERWFDIVFVLRTKNDVLYERLVARGYDGKKLENNIEAEIFQTILDEARESYREEIVHELESNCQSDVEKNAQRITTWMNQWIKDNKD